MVIALAGRQDAFIMVREFDQVDPIPLAIIGVYFFTAFEIIQGHTEVFAAGNEVPSVMRNIN